jgi:hypothetical protein
VRRREWAGVSRRSPAARCHDGVHRARIRKQPRTTAPVIGICNGHLLGYARGSTTDQQHLQVDALAAAGCYRVFTETASGARADRPILEQVLDQLRPGDTLVVWKLDLLGRSLRDLVDTVTELAAARARRGRAGPRC